MELDDYENNGKTILCRLIKVQCSIDTFATLPHRKFIIHLRTKFSMCMS